MQNNWVNFFKVAFLPHARFFRCSKGEGAWPKWPNGKYAYGCTPSIRTTSKIKLNYSFAIAEAMWQEQRHASCLRRAGVAPGPSLDLDGRIDRLQRAASCVAVVSAPVATLGADTHRDRMTELISRDPYYQNKVTV